MSGMRRDVHARKSGSGKRFGRKEKPPAPTWAEMPDIVPVWRRRPFWIAVAAVLAVVTGAGAAWLETRMAAVDRPPIVDTRVETVLTLAATQNGKLGEEPWKTDALRLVDKDDEVTLETAVVGQREVSSSSQGPKVLNGPSGNVAYYEGSRQIGTAPLGKNDSVARLVTDFRKTGEREIRAVYAGDERFRPSEAAVALAVGPVRANRRHVEGAAGPRHDDPSTWSVRE